MTIKTFAMTNGKYYSGKIIKEEEGYFLITDKFNNEVKVYKSQIVAEETPNERAN